MEDIGPQISTGSTHLTLLAQELQICLLSRAHADSHREGSWENYNGLKAPPEMPPILGNLHKRSDIPTGNERELSLPRGDGEKVNKFLK